LMVETINVIPVHPVGEGPQCLSPWEGLSSSLFVNHWPCYKTLTYA
jgi:hypothetical protein